MQRKLILAAITAALTAAAAAHAGEYTNGDLLVEASELRLDRLDDIMEGSEPPTLVIDVRAREDYLAGHIPGAIHIAPDAVAAPSSPVAGALRPLTEVAAMLSDLGMSPETSVLFYDDKGGFHAARMFWLAEYLGHRQVSVLNGGLTAWIADGGALETGAVEPRPGQFVPAPMARRVASADWILERRHDETVAVIDVRPTSMFEAGHIPWAVNVPWSQNLTEEGMMKPEEDLRAHFEAHGIGADTNVVIHCQVGLASSHSYLALRLIGHERVRVYHRSWSEWGSDPALPAEGV